MCGGAMPMGNQGFQRGMGQFQQRNMGYQGQPVGSPPGAFGKSGGWGEPQGSGGLDQRAINADPAGFAQWQQQRDAFMGQGRAVGSPPSAFGFGQTGGRQVWNEQRPMPKPMMGGPQAVGSPPGAFGKGPGMQPSFAVNEPTPQMVGSPPSAFGKGPAAAPQAFDPYKQFAMGRPGEIPGMSNGGGYGTQGNPNGMTGMGNPGAGGAPVAPPNPRGVPGQPMTDMFQNPGKSLSVNGEPANTGPMWDGFSQMNLSTPSGSMGFDPATMQNLGFNGLRASLTQRLGGGPMSDAAKFWVTGAGGQNLGSLDQLGATNGLDLRNLGPGAKINWSGLGPQGAVLAGNGRRY